MKRLALLVGLAILAIGVLFSSITSLASPETSGAALVVVDINVADEGDPDGHAVHIGMSAQLTLNINFDFNIDSQTGDITIDSLDGTGWVSVSGAIQDGQIFAHGSGKVAGFQDIAVIFEGKFDEEGGLSGQYRMGTALGLPPNDFTGEAHPIKYTVKPNRVCEPGGVAGCPPTNTPTQTEEGQPPTPTPTTPAPTDVPSTSTPVPTSTPPPVALTEHVDFGCANEIEVTIRGNGNILGGDDEGIRIDCGLDYAPDGGTGQFDFNESEVVIEPNGIITSSDEDGITIEIVDCEESTLVQFGRRVIRAVETRCRAIFRIFDSFFGGAGGAGLAPSAVYETGAFTLTGNAAFPPFGATLDSGPIDLPLVQTGGAGADVASLTRVRITFSPFGDVNCDMQANSIDVALILQFIATLLDELNCQDAGDVNWSDAADAIDVALILQFIAGLLPGLPVPAPEQPPPMPATVTPVPSSTPVPPPTAPPATATSPPATSTDTPTVTATPTETPETGKVSITVEGGPGSPIEVFMSDDCTGSAFASVTVSGSISLSFSPGSYSIMAGDVDGWELVEGVEACQEVDLTAGQKVDVTFTYQPVA